MPDKKILRKILIILIKTIVIAGAYYFVFKKIYNSPDLENIKYYFSDMGLFMYITLFLIIILMFLNWSIESVKWKVLVDTLENISFINSFKAIWTGITVGIVTPNRVGEFGGRILFLKKESRLKATSLTLYGDLSQFIVTIIFGIMGFYLISSNILFYNSEVKQFEQFIWGLAAIVIVITLFFYFNINFCLNKLNNVKKLKNISEKFTPDREISFNLKIKTILFSIIRYITFSVQFYLALLLFGVEISIIDSLIATSSIYLSLNIIPNIPFAEIGLRSSFAVIFLGFYTDKITAVVLASLLIYIINVGIPTLIGGLFLLKKKRITQEA
ncbi:MAG: flippase-like domain-containing protein [Bacteroidales bacterium]|jgi:uncharacterized membrane protein YbhN (UPF0104 family)|nr:flippase-like domain-containing protein [Bacteroidales bacterium]